MRTRYRLAPFVLLSILIHAGLVVFPRSAFDPVFPRSSIAIVAGENQAVSKADFEIIDFEIPAAVDYQAIRITSQAHAQTSRETIASEVLSEASDKEQLPPENLSYFPPVLRYITMPSIEDLDVSRIEVVVEILVDETGRPQKVNLPDTLGFEIRERLRRSAMLFRFQPASEGGVPVASWIRLPITITAGGSSEP